MKTLKFKTNINCGGCIAKITHVMDTIAGKGKWNVDTNDLEKILTVQAEASYNEIETAIKNLGFKIEPKN
jgi:copper chaperone CopZ